MKAPILLLVGILLLATSVRAEDSGLPPPVDSSASSPDLATPDPLNPEPSLGTAEETPAPESQPLPTASEAPTPPVVEELAASPSEDPIDQHLEKEKKREDEEKRLLQSELVQHEGGKNHIGLDFAFHAFDDFDFDPSAAQQGLSTNGVVLQYMYFPVTHGWGRLGLGPVVGGYWTNSASGYKGLKPSFITYALEMQYDFLYSIGQTLVPFALAGYEGVSLGSYIRPDGNATIGGTSFPSFATVGSQKFSRGYYGGGLALNLNRLEHRAASRALADIGIRKFYLVFTWKVPLSNGTKGNGLLGLRFEY